MDPQLKREMPLKPALTREETKKIMDLIRHLEKRPECYDFLKPVDFKGLGLDDYPIIIKRPMDFSTIKRNLKTDKYKSFQEALADVLLIWDNCKLYNQAGSPIYQQAEILEDLMKKYCEKNDIRIERPVKRPREEEVPPPVAPPQPVQENASFESKVELAENVRKVSHEILAEIVKIVETNCKSAMEELGNERLQIKVDELDRPTYEKLRVVINGYLQQNQEGKPVKKAKN
ncbi:unnamed protein product [Blepharisma stoltei]|uniref:Bromo domain-containing protein n=1 Tax=Blepharisma stoltei TaxID=1481888 RepID=A0AAU9IY22_9CILI|nr:unnamed protein product [Blepharisma stoltei]